MADNRKIIHGVDMGKGKVITDVDELAKVLTPEMLERLTKTGSIEGDWKTVKTEVKPEAEEEGESESVDFSSMKKDELLDEAASRGVEVDSSMTKADIIAALEKE